MFRSVHMLVHSDNAVSITIFRTDTHRTYSRPTHQTLERLYDVIWTLASRKKVELFPSLCFPGWTAYVL